MINQLIILSPTCQKIQKEFLLKLPEAQQTAQNQKDVQFTIICGEEKHQIFTSEFCKTINQWSLTAERLIDWWAAAGNKRWSNHLLAFRPFCNGFKSLSFNISEFWTVGLFENINLMVIFTVFHILLDQTITVKNNQINR